MLKKIIGSQLNLSVNNKIHTQLYKANDIFKYGVNYYD